MSDLSLKLILSAIDRGATAAINKTRASINSLGSTSKGAMGMMARSVDYAATRVNGLALGVGALGGALAVKNTMGFDHALTMLGNTSGMTAAQLEVVKRKIDALSTTTNQSRGDLLQGLTTLINKGLDPDLALGAIKAIGTAATATGANVDDLSKAAFTMMDTAGIAAKDLPEAINMIAKAGDMGGIELNDMAKAFPTLTAGAKALGLQGKEAIATLAAGLQVALKGAADPSTAANNYANFLQKIASPDAVKEFKKFGVNIESEMKNAVKKGENPLERALEIIQAITGGDKFKLGKLFQDMQVGNFLQPMMQQMEAYRSIKQGIQDPLKGTNIEIKHSNILKTDVEQAKLLRINLEKAWTALLGEGPLDLFNKGLVLANEHAGALKGTLVGIAGVLTTLTAVKLAKGIKEAAGFILPKRVGKSLGSAANALNVQKVFVVNMPGSFPGSRSATSTAAGAAAVGATAGGLLSKFKTGASLLYHAKDLATIRMMGAGAMATSAGVVAAGGAAGYGAGTLLDKYFIQGTELDHKIRVALNTLLAPFSDDAKAKLQLERDILASMKKEREIKVLIEVKNGNLVASVNQVNAREARRH